MDETISYLQDRFKEEQGRFDQVENKSAKFFTAVSVLVAGLSALAALKNGILFQIQTPLAVCAFVAFAMAAFAIACAWGHALSALSIKAYPSLPSSRETAEYLKAVDASSSASAKTSAGSWITSRACSPSSSMCAGNGSAANVKR